MSAMVLLSLAVGLVLLTAGAEFLVRGASHLAALAGVSSLVIGLTVVAFGTSAPEFAVSLNSAFHDQSDIALGNVVGSNIFNVLFILGVCALILPLRVDSQLVRWDVPLMIGVSVLLFLMCLDGEIGRVNGALLFAGIVAYTAYSIWKSRSESAAVKAEYEQEFGVHEKPSVSVFAWNLGLVVTGLVLLVVGARLFVDGAVTIAEAFGVSQLVIGLTVVAAGTSLPEVATSIVATIRGERDIAIGNVVGSNIFNILSVLGAASLAKPIHVASSALWVDIPVMLGVALICLPIFFTGLLIRRWEGLLFLGLYVLYTTYLILHASTSPLLPQFSSIMVYGLLPAVAVVLLATSILEFRNRDRAKVEAQPGS
ncbi:MAG: calcium/sodium antiporter [Candidatus Hydrogenedentes bacterium]|nr:calcium/sodium antiporter [Candidatus Hydrogenedentota bacterium]